MNRREHQPAIDRACRRIEASETPPDLATLAAEAGLSPVAFPARVQGRDGAFAQALCHGPARTGFRTAGLPARAR